MLLRRVARPLLAGIFIQGGIAALRDPKTHADMAAPVLDRAAPVIDKVVEVAPIERPPPNETLVQIDAAVKIGAGTLLALGVFPRLSAAALAPGLIATTAAAHRFWEVDDPSQRMNQQVHFVKNLGLLGGLMLAAADTGGKPSLAWRARHAGRTSAAAAELFHQDVTEGLGHLSERAGHLTHELAGAASKAGGQAAGVASHAGERAAEAASRAGHRLAPVASKAGERAAEVAGRVGEQAAHVASRAGDRVAPLASRAGERVSERAEHWLGEAEHWLGEADVAGSKALEHARKAGEKARKRAEKAGEKARKRGAKRLEAASKRGAKQIERAQRRASKRLHKVSQRASKEAAWRRELAAAKAREVRATVGSRLA